MAKKIADRLWKRPYLNQYGKGAALKGRGMDEKKKRDKPTPPEKWREAQEEFKKFLNGDPIGNPQTFGVAGRAVPLRRMYNMAGLRPAPGGYPAGEIRQGEAQKPPIRDANGKVIWANVESTCGMRGDDLCQPKDKALIPEWKIWKEERNNVAVAEIKARAARQEQEAGEVERKRPKTYHFAFPDTKVNENETGYALCMTSAAAANRIYVNTDWSKVGCDTCKKLHVYDGDEELNVW